MKKIQYSIISLILTLSLALYFFSNHALSDVLSAINNVPTVYVFSFFCFSMMMSFFRTWRYYLLLLINGYKVPVLSLLLITIVRNLFADLLPARLGTLMYIYLVRTRLGISLGAGTSSYAYSFLFDLIGNCPVIIFCLISLHIPKEIPVNILFIGVLLLLIITFLVIKILPLMVKILGEYLGSCNFKFAKEISQILEDTEKSLRDVEKAKIYDRILLLSVAIRVSKYAALYVFLLGLGESLGLDKTMLDPGISLLGLLSGEFAASLPVSGIAGFGAYEGAWAFTFKLLGIDLRIAEITAVSHHLFTQFYAYSLGIISMLILLVPYFYYSEIPVKKHEIGSSSKFYLVFLIAITGGVILAVSPILALEENKSPVEFNMDSIKSFSFNDDNAKFPDLIFDSNRDGTFGIYGYELDSKNIIKINSTKHHEMFPDVNSDKTHIVFSRHISLQRGTLSDIILLSLKDGTEKTIDSGAFPTFSADGFKVYYEKNRSSVFRYSLADNSRALIFPKEGDNFGSFQIVKPRMSPDESSLVFTSDKAGRWHAWMVNLVTREQAIIGKGCEPVFHPKESKIIWVSEEDTLERSGFYYYNIESKTKGVFHDRDAPWGHEYFPSFSKDGAWFIYSASPPGEHSHERANYQIFIKNMLNNEIMRISEDRFTNRWGKAVHK
ncbi:MAG TPA: flippase-like domain-containing protein [Oligoflexia bacterium]|nr:flippase-like domain-containing protein [Oligoflexia bacterium]HMP47573.1 flippase-like domain-containing protein [Oligoflexia bacterium]